MAFPQKKKDFNIETVRDNFMLANKENDQISLKAYVDAFTELCRFFRLTGTLFGFVATDLQNKLDILTHHMNGDEAQHYVSVQSMVEYEVQAELTQRVLQGRIKSGCRTLLRLHRALEFILQFIDELARSHDDAKSSVIAARVYDLTLAHYHNWLVRGMAHLAVKMLPTRRKLIEVMCAQHDDQERDIAEEVRQISHEVVQEGQQIYDVIQKMYTEHGLLTLP